MHKSAEKSAALSPPKLFKQSSAERAFTSPLLWDLEHAEQAYTKVLAKCQFAPDAKMHSGVGFTLLQNFLYKLITHVRLQKGKSIHAFSKTLTMAKGKTVNKKRMKRIAKELKVCCPLDFYCCLQEVTHLVFRYSASTFHCRPTRASFFDMMPRGHILCEHCSLVPQTHHMRAASVSSLLHLFVCFCSSSHFFFINPQILCRLLRHLLRR